MSWITYICPRCGNNVQIPAFDGDVEVRCTKHLGRGVLMKPEDA